MCHSKSWSGKPKPVRTIAEIWRGRGHPRKILLLDNDFFGQPREEWLARIRELREGNFRVCFARLPMPTGANDPAVFHQNATDARVGRGRIETSFGETQCMGHEGVIGERPGHEQRR